MTKTEVLKQVYGLSVNGNFNGEHLSFTKFKSFVEETLDRKKKKTNDVYESADMRIKLPDGVWFMSITRFRDGFWDYYIPETREDERRVFGKVAV